MNEIGNLLCIPVHTALVNMHFGVQPLSNSALNTPILEIRFHGNRPELPKGQNKEGDIGVEAL
jgi:hypothetical protein